jgi:NADPH:quinone reductase-like Zn-dependent oxidoreductase
VARRCADPSAVALGEDCAVKAAVVHRYGGPEVVQLADVPTPEVGPGDVLVRVHASTVARNDTAFRAASPFINRFFVGLLRPKRHVLGSDFVGAVERVGAEVHEFSVGQRVFGHRGFAVGAHAELMAVPTSSGVTLAPSELSDVEAAAVLDGVVLGLPFLRAAGVVAGTRVAVYGASGSIGTALVQLCHDRRAHVTAVCGPEAAELVRSLGADVVVNRHVEDFCALGPFDVIIDSVGKLPYRSCRHALTPNGMFLSSEPGKWFENSIRWLLTMRRSRGRRVSMAIPTYGKADVEAVRELVERRAYRAVVDRVYPFEQVVDAHRFVDTHTKVGNVVLTIS